MSLKISLLINPFPKMLQQVLIILNNILRYNYYSLIFDYYYSFIFVIFIT